MTREITGHEANEANKGLRVRAMDEPGHGGACHDYLVEIRDGRGAWMINFQNGSIKEVGVNGLTPEVLIAIVMDRLASFQKGAFACVENEHAYHHLDQAFGWLASRTRRRVDAGVEGTLEKMEGEGDGPFVPPDLPPTPDDVDTEVRFMPGVGAVKDVPSGEKKAAEVRKKGT
jgi:hypothetical protein